MAMKRQIFKEVPTEDKVLFHFRVIAGHHSWNAGTDENPKLMTVLQGEEFECNLPLDEMGFNAPGSIKFQRINKVEEDTEASLNLLEKQLAERRAKLKAKQAEPKPAPKPVFEKPLQQMSMVELQELAEANGIDISAARVKADIVRIIEEATVTA